MLVADFFAAAIPIAPFAIWPVHDARIISATVTLLLLIGLGIGRAWIGDRRVAIGVAAALAGVAIGVAIARSVGEELDRRPSGLPTKRPAPRP